MALTHINPESLDQNPVFSQGVLVERWLPSRGGWPERDRPRRKCRRRRRRNSVGSGLRNVIAVLEEAGATQDDVAQLTVYLVAPADATTAFASAQEGMGEPSNGVSVIQVSGLARPDCLVEVSALALVS